MPAPLLCVVALLAAAAAELPSASYGPASSLHGRAFELRQLPPLQCASLCDRRGAGACSAFSSDGTTCRLLSDTCRTETPDTAAAPDVVPVTHQRLEPQPSDACMAGWHFYRSKCYLRADAGAIVDFNGSRAACPAVSPCARLLVLGDANEEHYLLQHAARPSSAERIGLIVQADGTMVSYEGTVLPYSLSSVSYNDNVRPACINLRNFNGMMLMVWSCDDQQFRHHICESPLQCAVGQPCPDGWFGLDDHCYHYVQQGMSWHGADAHCAALQAGAHLAPIPSVQSWRILQRQLFPPEAQCGGCVWWVGATDEGSEGSWRTVDGTTPWLPWGSYQPDNADGIEHCAEMFWSHMNDIPCTALRWFLCRVPKTTC